MLSEQVIIERDRTTFRLPKPLKKAIATESFFTERDMTDIIVEQLLKRYPDVEAELSTAVFVVGK